jgi:hypothetical protein
MGWFMALFYPHAILQLLKTAIEIVDLPIENGDFP